MPKLSSSVDLIKKSWVTFFEKENLKLFLKVYVLLIPFSALSWGMSFFANSQTQTVLQNNIKNLASPWLLFVGGIFGLAGLIVNFWIVTSGIVAVASVVDGKKRDVSTILKEGWNKVFRYSIFSLVAGLIIFLGFLLLIIPGFIFATWLTFAGFEMVIGGKGIKDSLVGSRRLVSGRFWQIFGKTFVFGIFSALFQLVFVLIPYDIGSIVLPLFGALFVLPGYFLYKEVESARTSV